jgi:hypothetical protein
VPELERPSTRAPGEAADGEELSESAAVAPSNAPGGQGTSASGGYGTRSAVQSSGGSGSSEDDTSAPGEDVPTDWLRSEPNDEPGGLG